MHVGPGLRRGTRITETGMIHWGDTILSVNEHGIKRTSDLTRVLDKFGLGDIVQLTLVRDNQTVTLPARLLFDRALPTHGASRFLGYV